MGTTIDYMGIVSYLIAAADSLLFLKVLLGNQVCIVHLVGRLSCGIGRPTASHNRIFGILREKAGKYLYPIVMVRATGLVP